MNIDLNNPLLQPRFDEIYKNIHKDYLPRTTEYDDTQLKNAVNDLLLRTENELTSVRETAEITKQIAQSQQQQIKKNEKSDRTTRVIAVLALLIALGQLFVQLMQWLT